LILILSRRAYFNFMRRRHFLPALRMRFQISFVFYISPISHFHYFDIIDLLRASLFSFSAFFVSSAAPFPSFFIFKDATAPAIFFDEVSSLSFAFLRRDRSSRGFFTRRPRAAEFQHTPSSPRFRFRRY